MLGETKSWADIPETFLLKEYHKYIPIKRRSVFSQLKKWKTKLCFPWSRNDACSRLMVHLFTNRFCVHSSKMPINHVESAMKCFTAAVHNPQFSETSGEYWYLRIFVILKWYRRRNGGLRGRRSFKQSLFWNSAEACREHLLHMNGPLSMLAWLIIAFVTVAGTGTLAYFYYKLLDYFIRMKIEAEPDPEPLERETKLKRAFRVQEGQDSDEERINIFREINNSDMTIERTWKNRQLLLSRLSSWIGYRVSKTYKFFLVVVRRYWANVSNMQLKGTDIVLRI